MNTEAKKVMAEIQNLNTEFGIIRPTMLEKLTATVETLQAEIPTYYVDAARRRLSEVSEDWQMALSDAFNAIDYGVGVASEPLLQWGRAIND